MNIGQNKPLVIGGGLLFLLMIACGYFLWTFHGKNKSAAANLETQKTTLDGLVGSKKNGTPSPTLENARTLQAQIDAASAYYTNYVGSLFKELPPERNAEPSDFQLEVGEVVENARAFARSKEVELGEPEAAAANMLGGFQGAAPGVVPGLPGQVQPAVETEEVFFMDFEKYTKDGERPERSHIPRLSRQLAILDDLTRLMVESQAERILSVEREKFDLEAEAANQGGFLNLNQFGPGFGATEVEEEDEIAYENEVFKVRFLAAETNVFRTLDAINQLPYPASISQLHIKNQHPTMIPFQDVNPAGGILGAAGFDGAGGLEPGAMPSKKSMKDLILFAGREPVEVYAEIYVATPPAPPPEETGMEGL